MPAYRIIIQCRCQSFAVNHHLVTRHDVPRFYRIVLRRRNSFHALPIRNASYYDHIHASQTNARFPCTSNHTIITSCLYYINTSILVSRAANSNNRLWWPNINSAIVAWNIYGCSSLSWWGVGLELADLENVGGRPQLGDVEVAVRGNPAAVLWDGQAVACGAADEVDGDAGLTLFCWSCES